MKQMLVCAYAMRGDISVAVDNAREMYNQAKKVNYNIGLALSSQAIGDSYLNTNMQQAAIGAYKEALQTLEKEVSNTDRFKIRILPKFILTLIKNDQLNEAKIYLNQLDNLYIKTPTDPIHFFILSGYAYYYIKNGDLKKAKTFLDEAASLNKKNNFLYHQSILNYILAIYYEESQKYDLALEQYKLLSRGSAIKIAPNKHIQLKLEMASLLTKMGQLDKACLIYQNINEIKDSLDALSYSRQINELRAVYQIDQMEIRNQKQRNQITQWIILAIIFILLLISYLIFHIKQENKRLRKSKEELDLARRFAESSVRTKSVFLSNMSHEIRTPLNALSGFSSILTEESIDNETRKQCNDIIQQNSELLLKLINDVIDLSSLEVGKLTFNFKTYDAVTICRNVIETVEKVKQTQASVVFITQLNSLALITDDSRLQQVLINLLINATKFTTMGSITLELQKRSDTEALFSVTDTGCGIPLENQKNIFNRFEKLNEGAQGTGLGLSICQLIIEQIGGKIWIDSEYTDGARFLFTHPIQSDIKKEDQV